MYDLHIHSTYSDGKLDPMEIVDLAIKKGLRGIAITDHDNIDAIKELKEYNIDRLDIISGVELSCKYKDEEIHILGYNFDISNIKLLKELKKIEDSRFLRGRKIVDNLNKIGINISFDDVKKESGNKLIGRPHIGRVLIKKGYVKTLEEAFNKYIGFNSKAYVERYQLPLKDGIELIHSAGGKAILAHPKLIKNQTYIEDIIDKGIDGIEVYHSKHSKKDEELYNEISLENNLIITGGSDCHGEAINGNYLLGEYRTSKDSIDALKS